MFEIGLRIAFSLLVVFGLMWGLARIVRRPLTGKHGGGTLWVLNRQQLTRGASVAVVQVADRALIVGVTDQTVSLLGETELEAFEKHPHEHRDPIALVTNGLRPRSVRGLVDALRDRTTRG